MPELNLPTPGVTGGPGWASQLNTAIESVNAAVDETADVIETGRLSETALSATIGYEVAALGGGGVSWGEDPNDPGFFIPGGLDPNAPQPPAAPTNFRVIAKTATTVTFAWDPVEGADSYRIVLNGTMLDGGFDTSGTRVSPLQSNTTYTFSVVAINVSGRSAESNSVTVTTDPETLPAPAAPTNLASPSKTDTTVDLTWDAVAGAVGYRVFRNGVQVSSYLRVNYFTDANLTASTAYSYTVTAVNEDGVSPLSAPLTVTTNASPAGVPGSLTLSSPSKTASTVDLSWTAATGVDRYLIYRGSTYLGTRAATSRTYTASGLTASTAYQFTVRAQNSAGVGPPSTISVTTSAATGGGGGGGRPTLVRSFGPNGTHYPASTPWFTETSGITVVDVACTWAAIAAGVNGLTDAQANAGARIRVAPGTLTGSGAATSSAAVLSNLGNAAWTKNVLIMPRDGWDTVKISGGFKLTNCKRISWFMPGDHTSGVFYLGPGCDRTYIGWGKYHSGNIKESGTDCGTYEVVVGFRQAPGNQDSFQGWPYQGTITGMEHHGSTFGPAVKLIDDTGHCDTVQYEAIGSNASLAGTFLHRDCVMYGSSNQTFQLAGPGGPGWNLTLDKCLVLGSLVWTRIFPIQSDWYDPTGNPTNGLGGGNALVNVADSFIVGKSNAQRYGTVSNTRIASTGTMPVPTSGAFIEDASIANWTAADIYSRTLEVHTATGINNLKNIWKW